MERLAELWRRLLFLFRRRQFDRDLEEEMRFHLEMKGRESGANAARRQFGNTALLQEDCRDAWGWRILERLLQDVRYTARTLRKAPGFTAVIIVTLALGIGVNTAIFSLVDRLLFRPLPFPDSSRLETIFFRHAAGTYDSLSYPTYEFYRDRNQVFSGLAAYTDITVNLRFGGDDESAAGQIVTANYFDVLQVPPILGRTFRPEEDLVPGRDDVAMISQGLWKRRFGGDKSVLGRHVILNGYAFTIVGIVPESFAGVQIDRQSKPEVWTPTMSYPKALSWGAMEDLQHYRDDEWLTATGRLKPGVTHSQASAQTAELTEQLIASWPTGFLAQMKSTGLLIPANESRFPLASKTAVTRFLAMLMTIVGLVLLIACANVASLLLARGVKRHKEIGVRVALGADRARLAQQLVSEGLLLSVAGGAAGIAVACLVERYLAQFDQPFHMGVWLQTNLDLRVLIFASALSVATGILFGLLPLRQASRLDVTPLLESEMRASGRRILSARNLLVVAQVALSTVLLAGAGLFVRTLRNAQAMDITRDPDKVLLFDISSWKPYRTPGPPRPLSAAQKDPAPEQTFLETLLDRVSATPGVTNAAYVMIVPLGGQRGGTGVIPYPGSEPIQSDHNVVSPGYFRTVGIPLVRGRAFTGRDRQGSAGVVIVNEQMAKQFWPGEDPVGKHFELAGRPNRTVEVVGVVRDGPIPGYRAAIDPCFYAPLAQTGFVPILHLEVRTAVPPSAVAPAIRHEIRELDPDLLIAPPQTASAFRDAGLGQERLSASLLSGLSMLAALIAAIGLYGVMAFTVARRTREIGVRVTLGAAPAAILRGVMAEALMLVAAGLAAGSLAAVLLARLIANLLFGLSATDPATYAATAAVLLAVGAAAAYLPARRASRVDPVVALRVE
jgi:predicted permease